VVSWNPSIPPHRKAVGPSVGDTLVNQCWGGMFNWDESASIFNSDSNADATCFFTSLVNTRRALCAQSWPIWCSSFPPQCSFLSLQQAVLPQFRGRFWTREQKGNLHLIIFIVFTLAKPMSDVTKLISIIVFHSQKHGNYSQNLQENRCTFGAMLCFTQQFMEIFRYFILPSVSHKDTRPQFLSARHLSITLAPKLTPSWHSSSQNPSSVW